MALPFPSSPANRFLYERAALSVHLTGLHVYAPEGDSSLPQTRSARVRIFVPALADLVSFEKRRAARHICSKAHHCSWFLLAVILLAVIALAAFSPEVISAALISPPVNFMLGSFDFFPEAAVVNDRTFPVAVPALFWAMIS